MNFRRRFRLNDSRSRVPLAMIAVTMLGLVGCGKVPTWDEMTATPPTPTPVQTVQSDPPAVAPGQPVTVPAAVPKEDPAQVLAWFKSLLPIQINDQALSRLTAIDVGLDSITDIDAKGGGVTNIGLAMLSKLPTLQKLILDGTPVTDEGMKALQRVPSLQSLSMNGTRISAGGLASLAALPGLKRMELMGCDLTQADFAAIGRLPALESLVLNRVLELNDAGLELICEARTLKSLQMNECVGLTDKGLISLAKIPQLQELSLNKSVITGVGLGAAASKGGLKSLKVLAVAAVPISLPGAKAINSLKTLESLDIGYIPGMNDLFFVEFVEGLKHLKSLNIEGSKGVFGAGFAKFKATTNSLETLAAKDAGLTDQGLAQLKGHKKLKFIDLTNTPVTVIAVQQFKKLVPNCEILHAGVRY